MLVRVTIDGERLVVDTGGDNPTELLARLQRAIFRCEVELLHLADGKVRLVNWRSVRVVEVDGA